MRILGGRAGLLAQPGHHQLQRSGAQSARRSPARPLQPQLSAPARLLEAPSCSLREAKRADAGGLCPGTSGLPPLPSCRPQQLPRPGTTRPRRALRRCRRRACAGAAGPGPRLTGCGSGEAPRGLGAQGLLQAAPLLSGRRALSQGSSQALGRAPPASWGCSRAARKAAASCQNLQTLSKRAPASPRNRSTCVFKSFYEYTRFGKVVV